MDDTINFKKETIEAIAGREIDEFHLAFEPASCWDDEIRSRVGVEAVYEGTGEIDWNLAGEKFCLKELEPDSDDETMWDYDAGYGSQLFYGWITFKDGTWIERHEYDGSEWWEIFDKPSLAKGSKG